MEVDQAGHEATTSSPPLHQQKKHRGNRRNQRFRRKCRAQHMKPKKIEKLLKKRNQREQIHSKRNTERIITTAPNQPSSNTGRMPMQRTPFKRKRDMSVQDFRSQLSTIPTILTATPPPAKRIKTKQQKQTFIVNQMIHMNYRRPMYLDRSTDILFQMLKKTLSCTLKTREEKEFIYERLTLFDQRYCLEMHLQLWQSYLEIGRQNHRWPNALQTMAQTDEFEQCEQFLHQYIEMVKSELDRLQAQADVHKTSYSIQDLTIDQMDQSLTKFIDCQRNYLLARKNRELIQFKQHIDAKESFEAISVLLPMSDQGKTVEQMMTIRRDQIKVWEEMLKLEMRVLCKFLPIEFQRLQQFVAPVSCIAMEIGSQAIELKNQHFKNIQTVKRAWLDMYLHIYEVQLQGYEEKFQSIYRQLETSLSMVNTLTKVEELVKIQTNRWKQEVHERMSTFRMVLLRNRQRSSTEKNTIGVSPEPYLDLDSNPFGKREWTQLALGPSFIRLNQTALRSVDQQKAEIKRECDEISNKLTNYLVKKPHCVSFASPYIKQCSTELQTYFHHSYFSMPIPYRDQLRALQQMTANRCIRRKLNDHDLTIRVTDKGHNFYIGSRLKFEEKGDRFFRETNAFRELAQNPFHEIKNKVVELLNRFRENGAISKKQYEEMIPDKRKCELAHLYFNPKTHKEGIPVRPIENTIHAPTTNISKFLDTLIRPIFNDKCHETNIIDSASFLERIVQYSKRDRLKSSTLFCTFDISNLYTMLPQEEALNILMEFLHAHDQRKVQGMSLDTIRKLAAVVIQENVFVYGKKIYRQVMGGAMGSSFTLTLANVFMWKWEKEFRRRKEITGEFYGRYVDDIFMTWNGTEKNLRALLDEANHWHPNIKLDFKIGQSLPFLDILVTNDHGTLLTAVYHKPSAEPYVVPFCSDHPRQVFANVVHNRLAHAVHYSTTFDAFNHERRYIKLMLLYNGYPSTFIENEFRKFFDKQLSPLSFLPFIHNETDFISLNSKYIPSNNPTDQSRTDGQEPMPTSLVTTQDQKTKTKHDNTVFIHYTYEKRFQPIKRGIHTVYHVLLDQSNDKSAKMIVGTRNRRSACHELIRKRPTQSLLMDRKHQKKQKKMRTANEHTVALDQSSPNASNTEVLPQSIDKESC